METNGIKGLKDFLKPMDKHIKKSADPYADQYDSDKTYKIIGAAQKVHTVLGPGFTENIYQAALAQELASCKIPFESQKELEVYYGKKFCGNYRVDLIVENCVIVELKAVSKLVGEHYSQVTSYLKASEFPVALLLNFGASSLQVRRLLRKQTSTNIDPVKPGNSSYDEEITEIAF